MQFRYSQVERALASMHFVPPEKSKAFRARIRNYQKIGLVPSSPGKGQKILYTTRDAVIWAICFELEEVGFTPEACKRIVITLQEKLLDYFLNEAQESEDDTYLVLVGLFLEWHLTGELSQGLAHISGLYSKKQIVERFLGKLQRLVIVSLSGVRRRLVDALAEEVRE